jgi:ring-1,2-phenylacetyl-CoA epoxidase subunit PaaC
MERERRERVADPALFELVARLADNKYFLGRRYAEWCSGAPALESGVAAAAMAQDELGHARAIYPLLRELAPAGTDRAEIDPDTRARFVNMAVLDGPFGGWPDFVAANFLVDTALSLVFEAARESRFEPLAARSRKVLQEERVHAMHGEAWMRRLARDVAPVREATRTAVMRVWDEVFCWLGPAGGHGALFDQHLLDAPPDELRERLLGAIGPTLEATGLDLPVRRRADGGWELTAALPWERWDPATYRLTARQPADVASVPSARAEESDR